ncbi:Secreted effector protein PipB2 [Pandoraea captiosa]|uniref:Secreted effector protein PipB2 n=1 Tax=Pandoraea captiosa TaxID=2508302 RepID=A0A5E5AC16_9BURK|nr:pentapeptide repeat-containing protein [Pandoraea captiosa]VVE71171.1 Secreted effector protein PipB2 [Pandoraea captiosa]
MPFRRTISFDGQAPPGAGALVPAVNVRANAGLGMSGSHPAPHNATPSDALRHAIMRADAHERRDILLQMSWLTYALTQKTDAGDVGDRRTRVVRAGGRADAAWGHLPFDRRALKRIWETRFSHLLHDTRADALSRDMVAWCSTGRDPVSRAGQWRSFSALDEAWPDVTSFAHLPMREWPARALGVALTLSDLRDADLPDLSLSDADLRGLRAAGATFCGGQFNGAVWCDARLQRVGFAYTNHVTANFEGADLRDACFRSADLSSARMVNADLRGATFSHTVMTSADLSDARCQGIEFAKVRADGATFHRAHLHGTQITSSSACGIALVCARAKRSRWMAVAMRNGRATGADLRGAEFRQCDLAGWDARGAKLNGAHFESCDMRGVRFSGASLKRIVVGPDCDLAGSQWHDARLRLDGAWLRRRSPIELDAVVRSWMTFPVDQPSLRASVFLQLLTALSTTSCWMTNRQETAPSLHRLPEHVMRSEWLGRLLMASPERGGVGAHEAFATLREQWVAHRLSALVDERLGYAEAQWVSAALMGALHRRCASSPPRTVWPYAGAMCQTLYWVGQGGASGMAMESARVEALRAAWFGALPPQVHVALSGDGVSALDPAFLVLIRGDGSLAARLPTALFAGALGTSVSGQPKDGDSAFADDPLPGWRWVGARVVARDAMSPHDFVPGTMRQLQTLLREFGCLSGIWPVERSLDAFVRLVGRWAGEDAQARARAACSATWRAPEDAALARSRASTLAPLSLADRSEVLTGASASPDLVKLRTTAHADIEEIFREHPVMSSQSDAPLSLSMSRRARWVSLVAGFSWLSTQPEWYWAPAATSHEDAAPAHARLACRRYALALLNETMTGDALWRRLPQALALRACLSDDRRSSRDLAQSLADWLTCSDIREVPGLAVACRDTLPWFWAVRFPLPADTTREAVLACAVVHGADMTNARDGVTRREGSDAGQNE